MRKNRNNELNRGSKKRFISVLPMIGAGLIAGGAIAGTVLSVRHVVKNYTESSEFAKTFSARVKIDPVALETDAARKINEQLALSNTKLAAERLSSWLKENGQESYDVQYELEKPDMSQPNPQYFAYLSAKFKLTKVKSKRSADEEKIDNDPYLSVFSNSAFNTNNKMFVYRWWNKGGSSFSEPTYSIFNFSDLFAIPEKVETDATKSTASIYDKDAKPGIAYKVNNQTTSALKEIYADIAQAKIENDKKESSNKAIPGDQQPRIYIINNMNGMFNELNYHLVNYVANDRGSSQAYSQIYKETDYYNFANEYYNASSLKNKNLGNAKVYINGTPTSGTTVQSLTNGDALNIIDKKTPGTVEHTSIIKKYVEDVITIGTFKNYFPAEIRDNVKNTVDETNPTKDNTTINHFWHSYSTQNAANNYINNVIKKSWKGSKIVSIDLGTDLPGEGADARLNKLKQFYKTTKINPKFTENIFGSKLVETLLLGLLAFLVVLGIVLGCLYRMTGVFSWICMMFMLSIVGLIAVAGAKMVISMSLIFGLFIMSIIGFVTALGICSRMKRRVQSNEDTQVIVAKTFKSSLWPSADASIVALIFGICFTYIAPLGLNSLGLVLIVGGFANFIGTYLLNGGLHALWFNNKLTINHFGWFGKHNNKAVEALMQGNNQVPTSLDATVLTFPYYSRFSGTKCNIANKKGLIITSVIGGLLIAAIITFAILGFTNSSMFHANNCLVVTANATSVDVVSYVKQSGLDYTSFIKSADGLTYYFSCSSISQGVLDSLKAHTDLTSVLSQYIVGSTNRDILNYALLSMLIGCSITFVYTGIRNNWTSFVPMLAGVFGLPLIVLGIAAASQVKFDEYVVLAFALTVVMNAVICMNFVNTINASWSRRDGYNKTELKFVVNTALKNNAFWLLLVFIAYALFITMFGVCAPKGSINALAVMIIGCAVTCLLAPIVISYLLYVFLIVRNKALIRKARRDANKKSINYDEIDEQSIEGLNKFTKHKPIPKDEPVHEQK